MGAPRRSRARADDGSGAHRPRRLSWFVARSRNAGGRRADSAVRPAVHGQPQAPAGVRRAAREQPAPRCCCCLRWPSSGRAQATSRPGTPCVRCWLAQTTRSGGVRQAPPRECSPVLDVVGRLVVVGPAPGGEAGRAWSLRTQQRAESQCHVFPVLRVVRLFLCGGLCCSWCGSFGEQMSVSGSPGFVCRSFRGRRALRGSRAGSCVGLVRGKTSSESLILAQDERWRRA